MSCLIKYSTIWKNCLSDNLESDHKPAGNFNHSGIDSGTMNSDGSMSINFSLIRKSKTSLKF